MSKIIFTVNTADAVTTFLAQAGTFSRNRVT